MTGEARKLLGGYATGTLTPEERSRLYSAALEDPALFEALADEQALKDLLDDSAVRAGVLEALENRRFTIVGALRDWLERPKGKLLAGLATVLLLAAAISQMRERRVEIARDIPPPQAIRATQSQPPPALSQTKRSERAAEPRATIPGAKPEPVPAVTASKGGADGIRYTILRRSPDATYDPVEPDFAFGRLDRARIRLEAETSGMLLVSRGGATLYAGTVSPEMAVLVPVDLTFETPEPVELDVTFTPLPQASVSINAQRAPEPAAEAARGVIGGVPGSQLRSKAAPITSDAPKPPSETVRIRIALRRK